MYEVCIIAPPPVLYPRHCILGLNEPSHCILGYCDHSRNVCIKQTVMSTYEIEKIVSYGPSALCYALLLTVRMGKGSTDELTSD